MSKYSPHVNWHITNNMTLLNARQGEGSINVQDEKPQFRTQVSKLRGTRKQQRKASYALLSLVNQAFVILDESNEDCVTNDSPRDKTNQSQYPFNLQGSQAKKVPLMRRNGVSSINRWLQESTSQIIEGENDNEPACAK